MEINFRNIFISAVCVAAVGGVGYAVYFDYKRRNDQSFRKELKKKKKAVEKEKVSEVKESQTSVADAAKRLANQFSIIKKEPIPDSQEDREAYLFHHLNQGEILANRGPDYFEESAGHIFRAICCCPNPLELVMLVEKMLPAGCYEIVVGLFTLEIKAKQLEFLEYYNEYPPSEMNVKLVEDPNQPMISESDPIKKYNLIAEKDFSENEVIYIEKPIISVLYPGLEGKNFCSTCLKVIVSEPVHSPLKHINSLFCSSSCLSASGDEFPTSVAGKNKALNVFKDAQESNVMLPSLMSRILNRIFKEHERQLSSKDKTKYTAMQHVERFIAAEVLTSQMRLEEETKLVQEYLSVNTEGVDQVVTVEYYAGMKGKLIKGSFGIVSAPEHPDVISVAKKNEGIRSVAPGLATGCGVYVTSSYLKDGLFEANTQAEFRNNDHVLTLVATKAIKKGDLLTVASFNSSAPISKSETSTASQDFPPLTQESHEPTTDYLNAEDKHDDPVPTYAEAVAESGPSADSIIEENIEVPSNSEIDADASTDSDKDLNENSLDQDKKPIPSYAEVTAEIPVKSDEEQIEESSDKATELAESSSKVDSVAPISTEQELKEESNDQDSVMTLSYAEAAAEAPASPKQEPEEDSSVQATELTHSYAEIAAETPTSSENVIDYTELASSQEFEKVEPIENLAEL